MADAADVELNRQLIILLGIAFTVLALVVVIVAIVATRAIIRANMTLGERYEYLLNSQLASFVALQREENDRLIADTRSATAKMNVMADALWDGLNSTVRAELPKRKPR